MALSVVAVLFFIYIFYGEFTIVAVGIIAVVSIFPIWLFIYALRELIKKTPHITFTDEELIIRDRDFYAWENIADFAFSIEEVGRESFTYHSYRLRSMLRLFLLYSF